MKGPFGLGILRKLLIAWFRITCYTGVFIMEAGWYAWHGRRDEIGDALGAYGRAVTDATADIPK
jgi:hypothetical protein